MRVAFAFVVLLILPACVPLAPRIYMPPDFKTTSTWGRMCEPEYTATLIDRDGITLRIVTDSISSGLFRGRLQLNVPQGHSAQFLVTQLSIKGSALTSPTVVPLRGLGCGSSEDLAPHSHIECHFAATLSEQMLEVVVPSFQVDNALHDVDPVRYQLQRVPMIVGACQ